MHLSDIQAKNINIAPNAYAVSDFGGLFILGKATGSKSWRFKYRLDGKEGLFVVGDCPAISLAQARKIKDAARSQVAQGIDRNAAIWTHKSRRQTS